MVKRDCYLIFWDRLALKMGLLGTILITVFLRLNKIFSQIDFVLDILGLPSEDRIAYVKKGLLGLCIFAISRLKINLIFLKIWFQNEKCWIIFVWNLHAATLQLICWKYTCRNKNVFLPLLFYSIPLSLWSCWYANWSSHSNARWDRPFFPGLNPSNVFSSV